MSDTEIVDAAERGAAAQDVTAVIERLTAELDALTAENERIRADTAQWSADRVRMAEEIRRLMLLIISEGIDPYVDVPGGLSRTELRAENQRLRAALNPNLGEGKK